MKRSIEPTIARCSITGWRLAVLVDVFGAEALRHHEIDLHGAELPRPADRVLQVVLDLGAVEGALARQLLPFHPGGAQGLAQASSALSQVASSPRRGSGRSAIFICVAEAELGVDRQRLLMERGTSASIWSSVQKMWPSSWVKPRTRRMPCSAPEGSLRWQAPNSP